jgi:hypothetical protein
MAIGVAAALMIPRRKRQSVALVPVPSRRPDESAAESCERRPYGRPFDV